MPRANTNKVGGASSGNSLTLFLDGDEAFAKAYEAIRAAQERVWMEMYILDLDEVGYLAIDALVEAAKRGCEVVLLLDRWGSPKIRPRHLTPIVEAGGKALLYNPFFSWRRWGRKITAFTHRNHRKILIADHVAFCGGRNATKEYGGPGPEEFFDVTLQLEGPSVRDLASVLADSFRKASGGKLLLPSSTQPISGGSFADVLALDAHTHKRDLDHALFHLLEKAKHECFLTTPYFIPPKWFLRALMRAVKRGVDVRILTAGRSDVPAARIAGRHIYGRLLKRGIRIYELQHPTLHAKYLTIDGTYGLVGSYNVDHYGAKRNLEVGVAFQDVKLVKQLDMAFRDNVGRSKEMNLESWQKRPRHVKLLQAFLYFLARM